MQKTITLNHETISKGVVTVAIVSGFVGILSYQVGYHQASKGESKKLLTQAEVEGDQRRKDQLALDRMASDYNTACYNYQVLYEAYDELYKKAGTRHERVVRPDGARGNEESCYR